MPKMNEELSSSIVSVPPQRWFAFGTWSPWFPCWHVTLDFQNTFSVWSNLKYASYIHLEMQRCLYYSSKYDSSVFRFQLYSVNCSWKEYWITIMKRKIWGNGSLIRKNKWEGTDFHFLFWERVFGMKRD